MPISRDRMKLYPGGGTQSKEWQAIRAVIRLRSGNCCEGSPRWPECRAVNGEPHPQTGSRVVLTVAHLTHDEACAELTLLRHWCQRCHNTYDGEHRRANAALTRAAKAGQPDLFGRQRQSSPPSEVQSCAS